MATAPHATGSAPIANAATVYLTTTAAAAATAAANSSTSSLSDAPAAWPIQQHATATDASAAEYEREYEHAVDPLYSA